MMGAPGAVSCASSYPSGLMFHPRSGHSGASSSVISAYFSSQLHPKCPLLVSSGVKLRRYGSFPFSGSSIKAVNGSGSTSVSPWDDQPFEILPNGRKAYLDEQDIIMILDPPKELIPLDPSSYNPAAYLCFARIRLASTYSTRLRKSMKDEINYHSSISYYMIKKKIEDIPEERRLRLLQLLTPRLVSRAWGVAGTRYKDPKLAKKTASKLLLSGEVNCPQLEYYYCQTSGAPFTLSWIKFFRKAMFHSKSGERYGRLIGESVIGRFASSVHPLYFVVRQHKEVMSTEQPCDLAYEFGDGLFDHLPPEGFPKPAKHPYPFNDEVVIYIRHIGPGVSVGQAWQEGKNLQQLPKKLCGEILMVKDYTTHSQQ